MVHLPYDLTVEREARMSESFRCTEMTALMEK